MYFRVCDRQSSFQKLNWVWHCQHQQSSPGRENHFPWSFVKLHLKKNRTVSVALFYCKMFFPKTSLAKNPLRFGSCLNLASKMNWCLNWDKKKGPRPRVKSGWGAHCRQSEEPRQWGWEVESEHSTVSHFLTVHFRITSAPWQRPIGLHLDLPYLLWFHLILWFRALTHPELFSI